MGPPISNSSYLSHQNQEERHVIAISCQSFGGTEEAILCVCVCVAPVFWNIVTLGNKLDLAKLLQSPEELIVLLGIGIELSFRTCEIVVLMAV